MARIFKNKDCNMCGSTYTPTSPKQKYCTLCKSKGTKINQSKRDKKRYKEKQINKILFTKQCLSCNITFDTYYGNKKYCGNTACEEVRIREKNKNTHIRRDKKELLSKGRKYYKNNREKCLVSKAKQYRERNINAKEYVPGKVHNHTLSYVKKYINSEGYKLISTEYSNSKEKLMLECKEGHKWETTFHNFSTIGNRCAICYQQNKYVSRPEQMIRDFLEEELSNINVIYNDRSVLSPKELDFYFPNNRFAIEVCGLYWHGENSGKSRNYHYNKMMSCYAKDVRLMTIFEDELNNQKEVVFSRIRQALGLPNRRIFARKCIVAEIDSKIANTFYSNNHVQGKSTALVRYGLFYNDELVSVGSLGKVVRKHTSTASTLELKRFCTLSGVSVIGGVGKIFSRMKKFAIDYGCTEIKSYCDMRYANIFKPVYEVLGFDLLTFTKYTPHYFKGQKRYRNFSLRKTPEERLTGKTEWELRKEQGYDRIWDCGHRTYIYKL